MYVIGESVTVVVQYSESNRTPKGYLVTPLNVTPLK